MGRSEGDHEHPHEAPGGGPPDPLAAAKRLARQRIDDERRRYPDDLGPVFEALATGLFKPGFNAKAVVPDPAARRRFRLAVGVTPRAYCDRQLLATALKLVRETTIPILEIAPGLGFDDPELFAKWFKWRAGEAPTTMRPPNGDPPVDAQPPVESTADEPWTTREYLKAAAWDVSPERGAALIRKIRELYPALDDQPLAPQGAAPCSTSNGS